MTLNWKKKTKDLEMINNELEIMHLHALLQRKQAKQSQVKVQEKSSRPLLLCWGESDMSLCGFVALFISCNHAWIL